MPKRKEITIGEKKNSLTCLGEAPKKNSRRTTLVACDCGNETIIQLGEFGRQKTCGSCPRDNITEHRFYRIWAAMKDRCYNENNPQYKDYGSRGIMVQDNWRDGPREFCEFLNTLPNAGEPGYSLDRIDNDGNYCEGNLRFATYSEQNLNKRPSKIRKDNKSGVTGIGWHKRTGKWQVRCKSKYIGRYQYFLEAVFARRAAESLYQNLSIHAEK